jgi:hypothetical protein
MAAQRRCRRFMGLALTSGPLLVAGVVGASPAQADAASYLSNDQNLWMALGLVTWWGAPSRG